MTDPSTGGRSARAEAPSGPWLGAGLAAAFGLVATLPVATGPIRLGLGALGTAGVALAATRGSRPLLLAGTVGLFVPVALAAVDGRTLPVLAATAAGVLAYGTAARATARRTRGSRCAPREAELVRTGAGLCVASASVAAVYLFSTVATRLPEPAAVPALVLGLAAVAWLVAAE